MAVTLSATRNLPKSAKPEMRVSLHRTLNDSAVGSYAFLLLPVSLSLSLPYELAQEAIPMSATVLAAGEGEPDERTLFNMERYFGYRPALQLAAA